MLEKLVAIWSYEIRIFPMLTALSIFGLLHVLRKISKIEYTPSYFAIFPLAYIENQISIYLNEYYGDDYISKKDGRPANRNLYIKSWISFFLTFLLVPLLVGFLTALFLFPTEFKIFIILLMLWEGWQCIKAMYDFYSYRGQWQPILKFFILFYLSYLFFLLFLLRQSYNFAYPFVAKGEFSELIYATENIIIPSLIMVVFLGVVTNLLAHLIVNKDVLEPKPVEIDEDNTEDEADSKL